MAVQIKERFCPQDLAQRLIEDFGASDYYVIPTLGAVVDWIREEHHIFIGSDYTYDEELREYTFQAPIKDMDTHETLGSIGAFSPEDALLGAIKFVLDLLGDETGGRIFFPKSFFPKNP